MESLKYYVEKIPDVLETIDKEGVALPDLSGYSFFGSGNAYQVARIYARYFNGYAYPSEDCEQLDKLDRTCIISASGGKDSIKVATKFKNSVLLTCNPKAPVRAMTRYTIEIPALLEPPFYNVTTYAAMIYLLSRDRINVPLLDNNLISWLSRPNIIFIAEKENHPIASMCALKVREIFGKLALSLTIEESYHGWFLHPLTEESVISIGVNFDLKDSYKVEGSALDVLSRIYYHIGYLQEVLNIKEYDYESIIKKRGWKL